MMKDYRGVLRAFYDAKKQKNPLFSLRAYAKYLSLSASTLVEVLNGKRNLSMNSAINIADKLMLTPEDRELFLTLVKTEKVKPMKAAQSRKSGEPAYITSRAIDLCGADYEKAKALVEGFFDQLSSSFIAEQPEQDRYRFEVQISKSEK